jgi:hypothetical protein
MHLQGKKHTRINHQTTPTWQFWTRRKWFRWSRWLAQDLPHSWGVRVMVFQQHETQTKQEIHAETLHRISNLMANVAPTVLVCSKHYFRLILFNSRNKKVRKLCFFWPQNAAHRKVEFLSLVEEQCRHLRKGKRINVQHGSCISSQWTSTFSCNSLYRLKGLSNLSMNLDHRMLFVAKQKNFQPLLLVFGIVVFGIVNQELYDCFFSPKLQIVGY